MEWWKRAQRDVSFRVEDGSEGGAGLTPRLEARGAASALNLFGVRTRVLTRRRDDACAARG